MTSKSTGRRVADIDRARLDLLHSGTTETRTLTECLAIDFAELLTSIFPDIGDKTIAFMQGSAKSGITKRMAVAAQALPDRYGHEIIPLLRNHTSDTVRGWACFAICTAPDHSIETYLAELRPLANDHHFGVREWAWLAVRPHIARDTERAIQALTPWTGEASEFLRRFACEAIRPRGVWCAHINVLKQHPEMALPVLAQLKADPSVYVQDSVSNWLNDASKHQPAWVRNLCDSWLAESPCPSTIRICKRALRSIDKQEKV